MSGLYLEDFVDQRTLAPYIAERRADYEDKAVAFLRQSFASRTADLDEPALRGIVQLAYPRARLRGIRTEPPKPGMMPSFVSGRPMRSSGVARR